MAGSGHVRPVVPERYGRNCECREQVMAPFLLVGHLEWSRDASGTARNGDHFSDYGMVQGKAAFIPRQSSCEYTGGERERGRMEGRSGTEVMLRSEGG